MPAGVSTFYACMSKTTEERKQNIKNFQSSHFLDRIKTS